MARLNWDKLKFAKNSVDYVSYKPTKNQLNLIRQLEKVAGSVVDKKTLTKKSASIYIEELLGRAEKMRHNKGAVTEKQTVFLKKLITMGLYKGSLSDIKTSHHASVIISKIIKLNPRIFKK